MYSSNWESFPTYDEWASEWDGFDGHSGEYWADKFEEDGLTQEAVRSTYINEESIQKYVDDSFTFGTINYYDIKLCYSEYKEGKWLPKKLSETVITTDRGYLSYEVLYGFQVDDVKDKISFYSRIQSDYLEINCTQKLDLQYNGGYLRWNDAGQFKFYFGTKEIVARDAGVYYSVLEPAGTSIYFNSFKEEGSQTSIDNRGSNQFRKL